MILSPQQKTVVDLPLEPVCVTACAGSGKTRTAVLRLAEVRRLSSESRGIVALLSFSKVAVDTFKKEYASLARATGSARKASAVEIDTVDGFFTRNVLRPHAHRTMSASCTPFLVHGKEPFLNGFKVFDGKRSHPTAELRVAFKNGAFEFEVGKSYAPIKISSVEAAKSIRRLGAVGAYTHSLGRLWALHTLRKQPLVLQALARRYPHIIVDEAQDVGGEHQALLEMMAAAGAQLSLVGDKNQSIYDFSGANGRFLDEYGKRIGVRANELTKNYRSVPSIVAVANHLANRSDEADREAPSLLNGAFYLPYKKTEKDQLLTAFAGLVSEAGLLMRDSVVLCRSNEWVDEWSGGEEEQGQGVIKSFVQATIWRDKRERYDEAFRYFCIGLVGLLDGGHSALSKMLSHRSQDAKGRALKRAIWSFVHDPSAGLPAGVLLANADWHSQLVPRIRAFLSRLEEEFLLVPASNLGQKLANRALLAKPIVSPADLVSSPNRFTFSTVHKVKGQSIDAVMYVADRKQVKELLDGTTTEVGRIGYVAVTRARNLFVLAIPAANVPEFEELLKEAHLKKPGAS